MEQFPSQPWVGATPNEAPEQEQPQEEKPILEDPFDEPAFIDIPEDIKDALENLQKKAHQTELPEIRIEE